MRDTEWKEKRDEYKDRTFYSSYFEYLYFFVLLCKPQISIQKAWENIFLLLNSYWNPWLLSDLQQFSLGHFTIVTAHSSASFQSLPSCESQDSSSVCGRNMTILKPSHSWWFKSCCFAMFMFPSHAQSLLLKSTTWDIPAPLLRISEWSIIHAVGTSVEFCFGHLHNWMSLSVKKGMLGRQLIRKLARGLMKWGSWVVSVYCLVPPHQAN